VVNKKYLVVGGAGFIGSNFVKNLLANEKEVIVIDSLISGNKKFLESFACNKLKFIVDDINNWAKFKDILCEIDVVIHLASNADIAAAVEDPTIDFERGTVITQTVAEMCRKLEIQKLIYASGSGVYGDHGSDILIEGQTELRPNSPYGASKLSGEAILSAYSAMFGLQVAIFRFANVVGQNQTHGVGLDFLRKLKLFPHELNVLGDGSQSKSYVHVDEIIDAINFTIRECKQSHFVCNITNSDRITVKDIANLAIKTAGLDPKSVKIKYGRENKGWAGDVPTVALSPKKLSDLGWTSKINSEVAIKTSLESLWEQINL
jgi:UDP-glucose 4-epimerase